MNATLAGVAPRSTSVVGSCGTTLTFVVASPTACNESPLYDASRVCVPFAPGSAVSDRPHWPDPSRVHVPALSNVSGPGVAPQVTVPVGVVVCPGSASVTVTVHEFGRSNRDRRGCAACADGHRSECRRDLNTTAGCHVIRVAEVVRRHRSWSGDARGVEHGARSGVAERARARGERSAAGAD